MLCSKSASIGGLGGEDPDLNSFGLSVPQLVRSQLGTVAILAAISMPAAAAARMEAIFIYFLWDSKSHRPISSKSSKSLHKKSRKSERRGSPRRSSSTDHLRTRAPLEIVGST